MFPGNLKIKTEPINTYDIDFVTDEQYTYNLVIKRERDDSSSLSYNDNSDHATSKTVICSESEYLAAGNLAFESIIVKEEPKFNDSPTTLDVNECSSNLLVKNWECYICKHVPAGNTVHLRRHIRAHKNSLVCKQCGQQFSTKHHLRQHEATHAVLTVEKRFSCDQCDRKFAGHSGLYRHKLIHNGEKSFACDQCDRKFLRQSTLRQHKVIHSGIKRFACDECDKKFSDSSTLYKHKQSHSKERPFACNQCDQRCSRKSTLIRHLGTHTGTKCFVCNICGKKFSRNSTLNHHKLLHAGTYPFACDKCDRKFVNKSTLNFHLQTHNEKPMPFKCDECYRSFVRKISLNQHKKTHKVKTATQSFPGDRREKQQKRNTNESTEKGDAKAVKLRTKKQKKLSKYTTLMNKCKSLRKI